MIDVKDIWNYYCTLSEDMFHTFRFVEPKGQEDVYSIEFAKIIILSCTELESVFKAIGSAVEGREGGNIADYKGTLLLRFPRIVEAEVRIPRLDRKIKPFEGWDTGGLSWWDAYTTIKHWQGASFATATFHNAIYALSALYISIFYLAKISNTDFDMYDTGCLESDYADVILSAGKDRPLPDFEKGQVNPLDQL